MSVAVKPMRIAVFASGNGSNFQAIADAVASGELDVSLELLVCDRPQAAVVERARKANVEVFAFRPKEYAAREDYEREILQQLKQRQVDLIVLAGYMRLITPVLVEPFYGRMINIHPSLLPSFSGVNAIREAFQYGVKVTGVTVHFVDSGLDTGPIIAQSPVEVHEADTEETLTERIHREEHRLFPRVIRLIHEGRVSLEGRKVRISN